jgi:hypothetical protein
LTLAEFRALSDAVEYERQSDLSYQRHFFLSVLMAQGVKKISPEKFLPLPLIDGKSEGRLKEQRDEILQLGREMFEKRLKNGRIKSKVSS